ncbi:protein kinase domain-containing protein [Haematococcus lacustris]|uniref:Protein kinase domain-containing protein n=1 Tax=Haematococcus lacustris TaxID=44745 RepID=A0A699ZFI0_HAELA|nr:protein kinase domain-containing protein [Haematococcus lacustris]
MRRALLICMEYCDMGTLADAMLRGTLTTSAATVVGYLPDAVGAGPGLALPTLLVPGAQGLQAAATAMTPEASTASCQLMSDKQSGLSSSSNVQLDTLLPAEPSPVESAELNLNFRPWSEVFASPRPEPGPQPVRKAPEVPCASRRARKAPAGSVFGIPVAPRRYSGTVTHLPPEAFGSGHGQVDPSIDIWAFGICMWELASGRTVYGELMSEAIILRAANPSMRPVFQGCVPQEYSQLAARCWDSDPNARPSAEELVQCLGDALAALRGNHTPLRRASSGQHASSLLLAQPAVYSGTHHARPSSQPLPASALPTASLLSTSQSRLGTQGDRDVQGQPPQTHLVQAQAWLGMWPHTPHDRQSEPSFMLWPHASGSSQRPVGGPSGAGWSKGQHAPLTPCDPSLTSLVQNSQTKQLRVGVEALQPAQSETVRSAQAYQDQDLGYRPSSPQDAAWLGNAGQPSVGAQMEAGLQQPLQHARPGLAHSIGGLSGITFDQARRTPSCCEERGHGGIMQHVRPWTPPTQDKPGEWDMGFPVHIL